VTMEMLSFCVFSNRKLIARLVVSLHFVYELQDKILRFGYWRDVVDANSINLNATWSLILVIVLLAVGCFSLLSGNYCWVGLISLTTFQIPTSILFEDSWYECFDSISALGGVLAVTAWDWEEHHATDDAQEEEEDYASSHLRRQYVSSRRGMMTVTSLVGQEHDDCDDCDDDDAGTPSVENLLQPANNT